MGEYFDIADQLKIYNEMLAPGIISLVKSKSKLADRFKKAFDTIDAHGKYARQRMTMAGSAAFGAKSSKDYPTGQESTPAEALIRVKRMEMFSMAFEGLTMELAERGGLPVDPQEYEQEELFKGMADDLARQLISDGSGIIATANGLGSTTKTLTLDHTLYAKPASMFFIPGRVLDGYLTASQEINSDAIDTVDSDTQLTLKTNASWTDNCSIYSEDAYSATEAVGYGEAMGLAGIIRETDPPAPNASAGLQGLTVALNALWKAKLYGNSGTDRPFDENLLITALQESEKRGKVTVLLITEAIFRVWKQYLDQYRGGGSGSPQAMWGGWVGLPFYYDGRVIPMVQDFFVPDGEIMGIAEDEFTWHLTNKNWITWEKVGGNILQKVAGKNAYVSEGHIFGNLGVRNRRPHFRIQDIDESGV